MQFDFSVLGPLSVTAPGGVALPIGGTRRRAVLVRLLVSTRTARQLLPPRRGHLGRPPPARGRLHIAKPHLHPAQTARRRPDHPPTRRLHAGRRARTK